MFKLKKMQEDAVLPTKAYWGDAGFDVFNHNGEIKLGPKERVKIRLGFALELKPSFVALIQEKSGFADKHGVLTIGNVIDSTYRGECHAMLFNSGDHMVKIPPFTKVAQMIIVPCYTGTSYEIVDELTPTQRGEGGFGSTGLEAK